MDSASIDHQAAGHDSGRVVGAADAKDWLVESGFNSNFTWDYRQSRSALVKLYEKAKATQWNSSVDLDWSTQVDVEEVASQMAGTRPFAWLQDYPNSPVKHFGDKEWLKLRVELQRSLLSQFLHGEQGALLVSSRIVESVPWIDAKYYGSSQVMDEARHVEVFGRYLNEKFGGQYSINSNLRQILEAIITESRWDITYLGMQIMIEGLALAAFGAMRHMVDEPLLADLLKYVMADEARHVAFGVLSLKELYSELSDAEMAERQEFAYETARLLQRRFLQSEVWETMGVDPADISAIRNEVLPAGQDQFLSLLFSKIVPNCKKLGLLDANGGWLRERFGEMGIIQFEDFVVPEQEALLAEIDTQG